MTISFCYACRVMCFQCTKKKRLDHYDLNTLLKYCISQNLVVPMRSLGISTNFSTLGALETTVLKKYLKFSLLMRGLLQDCTLEGSIVLFSPRDYCIINKIYSLF